VLQLLQISVKSSKATHQNPPLARADRVAQHRDDLSLGPPTEWHGAAAVSCEDAGTYNAFRF